VVKRSKVTGTMLFPSFRELQALPARPRVRPFALALPVLPLLVLFVITGMRGVDFGAQGAEVGGGDTQPVREMIASGLLLPRAPVGPAATSWLVLLPTIPSGLHAVVRSPPGARARAVQQAMLEAIDAPDFPLRVRRVFVLVSALALLWVYGAALALRRPWWEALVAAAGLGLSWQYAYHARWVGPDCVVAQFAALTLFMLAMFRRTDGRWWLSAGAAAAGLGAGTEYAGAVLLVPLAIASVMSLPPKRVGAQLARLAALGALAFAAYVVTTPATVLEPFAFVEQLSARLRHGVGAGPSDYAGYAAGSGWHHLRLVATYFAVSYFSAYRVLAVALAACALLGGVLWARSDRRAAIVLVSFPLVFVLWSCARTATCMVGDTLVVAPFLAVLAARGVAGVFGALPPRVARPALAAALGVGAVAQVLWLVRAAESIRHPDPGADVGRAVAWAAAHPGSHFRLSPKVRELAVAQKLALPPNVTDARDAGELMFFARAEGPEPTRWKSNDPWQAEAVFGPGDVDFAWYATSPGNDRVLVMSAAKAEATGVPLGGWTDVAPAPPPPPPPPPPPLELAPPVSAAHMPAREPRGKEAAPAPSRRRGHR
jgi:hypothetical protein